MWSSTFESERKEKEGKEKDDANSSSKQLDKQIFHISQVTTTSAVPDNLPCFMEEPEPCSTQYRNGNLESLGALGPVVERTYRFADHNESLSIGAIATPTSCTGNEKWMSPDTTFNRDLSKFIEVYSKLCLLDAPESLAVVLAPAYDMTTTYHHRSHPRSPPQCDHTTQNHRSRSNVRKSKRAARC